MTGLVGKNLDRLAGALSLGSPFLSPEVSVSRKAAGGLVPRIVTCAQCGVEFEARNSRARYCGATCRQRARRRKPPTVPPAEPVDLVVEVSVFDATLDELTRAGKQTTAMGQAALRLARDMDSPAAMSVLAGLARQHAALMTQLLAGTSDEEDVVDEVKKRRDAKAAKARQAAT